jgi:AcrR family transcriptional regulator
MQAVPDAETRRTFTEIARRTQIVEAAIETIAELGYVRASFAQIAKRAGLSSTGLISYHFTDKDELIEQVISEIFMAIGAFVGERTQVPSSPPEELRTHIQATVSFIATHRTQMMALLSIFMSGGLPYGATTERSVVSPIEEILDRGQRSGDFRPFDPRIMATVIQRAVDGLPFLLVSYPELDTDSYAQELVGTFERATQATAR